MAAKSGWTNWRGATFTEATVCTRDDPEPGLLSKIAGVFYAADVDVHSAQVFTRREAEGEKGSMAEEETAAAIAIDTLYVDFRGRQLTPGKRKELSTSLKSVLKGETTVGEILAKRKKSPPISTFPSG